MIHTARTILVVLLLTLQGCSLLQQDLHDPEIQVTGFSYVPGGNWIDQHFALRLQLSNPNDLELSVKGLQFTFAVAGLDLLQGESNDVPVIKPYSTVTFTVNGSANMISTVQLLKKMQDNPQQRLHYTLHAHVELMHGWPSEFNLTREGDTSLDDWQRKAGKHKHKADG